MGELLGISMVIAILFIPVGIYRLGRIIAAGFSQHLVAMHSIDQRLVRLEATLAAGQHSGGSTL